MRVALALAADLADQLQPRLGVPRLVLHHRGVIEPRLRVGRGVQELRRHLARDDVGLQLLHDDAAPDVPAPRLPLRRALAFRDRRQLVPRDVLHLPLGVLREVVEPQDARVARAVLRLLREGLVDRFGAHGGGPYPARVIALVFSYEVRDTAQFEAVYGSGGDWATFFADASGYIGTELLRDVEAPGRYLVIDRWESAEAYNAFATERQAEYMQRVDDTRFLYDQELRFGTFENVWQTPKSG